MSQAPEHGRDRFCCLPSKKSRYWTLVRIDATGNCKVEEIASAKAYILSSFPKFQLESKVPDISIQRQLLYWMREATPEVRSLAECSLKCFISCRIAEVCQRLVIQFGTKYGFTYSDLLPFVLDDEGTRQTIGKGNLISTSYQSVMHDILHSFDPDQSSLATWTTQKVKHHKELNTFLLEHGVYLISDWAILNDTSSKQLQRIFSQFHHLTSQEIQQAIQLLESYRTVYRVQRLQQRQAGIKGKCQPPTTEQLRQMQELLSTQTTQKLSPKTVMRQLQAMASRLREYRVYVRGGFLPTESLDAPVKNSSSDSIGLRDFVDHRYISDAQTEFLHAYRELFITCLDQAIAYVTQDQVKKLQSQDSQKAQNFLTALQLFYCQGKSMGEIAPEINLQAQFQVSRLVQLKSFRADIQQKFLVLLRDRVLNQAKSYTNPERLQALNKQIEEALDEQITKLIQEAAMEASTARGNKKPFPNTSLFAERLCHYLSLNGVVENK